MAYGLGMDAGEWHELRAQVDDSFWVMRIIGSFHLVRISRKTRDLTFSRSVGYPPLPDDHDGFSCGAHKYVDGLDLEELSNLSTGTTDA